MRRKVVVTVSAMIVAAQLGSPLAAAQPSVEQLGQIADYLSENNVHGLRSYLQDYPELTEGDTALARLLRDFLAESQNISTYLGFKPGLADSLSEANRSQGASDDNTGPVGTLY